tara:strand:- start:1550 stop:1795 length:246 start_codon:yes stop_codon:yes gene_type:complete
MADKNIYNVILGRGIERIMPALDRLDEKFHATELFDQEVKSHKEKVLEFDDMMSREDQLRQGFGDDIVDNYIRANQKLGGK